MDENAVSTSNSTAKMNENTVSTTSSTDIVPTKIEDEFEPSIVAQDDNRAISRGGWKTLPFIIGNEACERMGSLSVLWNLVPYLNARYNMSILRAAYISNAVGGTCSLTPLVGAYLADSYFGRYNTIVGASFFAFMGLAMLCVSATSKHLGPKRCHQPPALVYTCEQINSSQLWFLLGAFAFIAIGSGGLRSCVYSFGADQFDGSTPDGKRARQRFFNWFYFFSCVSLIFGLTGIVYIQTNISWQLGYLILAVAMVISVVIFVTGSRFFLHLPTDSTPYSGVPRVLVAAFSKHHLPLPTDPMELHTSSDANIEDPGPRLKHTQQLRFLDKAAIVEGSTDIESKKINNNDVAKRAWRLCTLQEVEECKSVIKLLPIWGCGILLQVVQTQLGVFSVGQAFYTKQYVGHLKIEPASLITVTLCTFVLVIPIYDLIIVPIARRCTKNPRGISLLRRIGIGMVGFTLTMVVAGLVENKRLHEAKHMEIMAIKWLIPQCVIIGISDTFAAIGQFEFFYEELPMGMKSMAGAFFWSSNALGSYIGNLVVFLVQKATKNHNWLPQNINDGHLDNFYYLLAGFSGLTLILFIICAHHYKPIQYISTTL